MNIYILEGSGIYTRKDHTEQSFFKSSPSNILFMKIKLPRKRKKAYKKCHSSSNYMAVRILGEILHSEGRKDADKFPKIYGTGKNRFKVISYW